MRLKLLAGVSPLDTQNGQGSGVASAAHRVGQLVGEIRDLLDEILEADLDSISLFGPVSGCDVARRLNELTLQLNSVFFRESETSRRADLKRGCARLLMELDELHDLTASYHRLGSSWSDVEARFCRLAAGLKAAGLIESTLVTDCADGTKAHRLREGIITPADAHL